MSSEDGRKILTLVQNCIERCLCLYMNQKEVVNTLYIQDNIEPHVTELVWQKLEEENQEFFTAYYLRLMVKEQIMEFNKLLTQQVELMRQLRPGGIASISVSNGYHTPPIQRNFSACRAAENSGPTLRTENMQHSVSANLQNVFSNCGSSMQSCIQTAITIASGGRNVDDSAGVLLAQSSNRGITNVMEGGVNKSESGYAGNTSFEFGGHNHFEESRSVLADASVSSFSGVESSSQPLNETLLDVDTSSLFFGQISQHLGVSVLGDVFANDSGNFLDPNDIERLNSTPESLRYQDPVGD